MESLLDALKRDLHTAENVEKIVCNAVTKCKRITAHNSKLGSAGKVIKKKRKEKEMQVSTDSLESVTNALLRTKNLMGIMIAKRNRLMDRERRRTDLSDRYLCTMAKYADMYHLGSYARILKYFPRIVNVVCSRVIEVLAPVMKTKK
jgi:hypothetical protein